MKKAIIAAILTVSSTSHALPVIYGADQCGSIPLPGVNSQDLRIECLGYTPFDPANPTKSGIASVLRINAPGQNTQNGVANLGWGQTSQTNGYSIGVQGIAESSGSLNGVRGGKFEGYTTGTGDDVAAVQALVGGSKSIDLSQPNILRGVYVKARASLPNPQPVDAGIELVKEQGASFTAGIKLNGASLELDDNHRIISVPNAGICLQYRPNVNAAWR